MRTQYIPPESESISVQAQSLICQSGMDEGNGVIDPITALDLSDDVWEVIL